MNVSRKLYYFLLAVTVSHILGFQSQGWAVSSAPECASLFSPFTDPWLERRVRMDKNYAGENTGKYVDPLTKSAWEVKYFTPAERREFQLFSKNGFLVNGKGEKAESIFDNNSLHFETSLIVINKEREILVLPFEERGRYHHSSLSAGADVIFAGTATFSGGKIRSLSDLSGHYKPDSLQSLVALRTLFLMDVDLSQMRIEGHLAHAVFGTPSMTPAEVQKYLGLLFERRSINISEVTEIVARAKAIRDYKIKNP